MPNGDFRPKLAATVSDPILPLETNFLDGVVALRLPTLKNIEDFIERFVWMRSRAHKSFGIGTITDNDPVDNVLNPAAAGAMNGDDRDPVQQALFDEGIQLRIIGKGRVQKYLASVSHVETLVG